MTLQSFRYGARTAHGALVTGLVRAESARAATVDLQRRALFVTKIAASNRSVVTLGLRQRRSLHGFYRAFSVLLRSGIVMRRALAVAITHCKERELKESLGAVLSDVEHGSSLSAAMARRPREFPGLHIAMIGAGELGGVLDEVLDRIASLLDRDHVIRKRIQSALTYPAVVAVAALSVILFLVARVVPMFAGMFRQFGAPLPMPTKVLMGVATTLSAPALPFVAIAFALVGLVSIAAVSRFQEKTLERFRFATPIVGPIFRLAAIARVARMLGMLLRCGVSILTSLEALLPVCGSRLYEAGLREIANGLRRGETLHSCMTRSGLFDELLLALVAAGDETGTVDGMLLAAADYLDVELEAGLSTIAALVEPALIGLLGVIVGFIVFSIFLPLYSLIGSLA